MSFWFLSPSTGKAPIPKPSTVDESSLNGKVVVLKLSMLDYMALESVKVRRLGDHLFLVGKVVESPNEGEAFKDKTMWQSLNGISQIIECENAEAAKKTLESMPKRWVPGWGGNPKGVPVQPIPPGKAKFK